MKTIANLYANGADKERELLQKRKFLEQRKIESQYSQVIESMASEQSLDISESDMDFGSGSITKANDEYVFAIQNRLPFINRSLSEFICLGGKTVYLIGGCTGQGKSTTVGNIITPVLDAGKKVLVLTNEEAREDVYNRVACQRLGKSFRLFKKGELRVEENTLISEESEALQSMLTVVSTEFKNNPDFVTTPQGVATVFEKFAPAHDLVILDYYQNINHSVASSGDSRPDPWVHQEKFAYWLNSYKNKFGKPIIIFTQLKRPTKNEAYAFEERVMGRKYIATVSLMHLEVRPDVSAYTTTFICHKDRFWGMAGQQVTMGFDWTTSRLVDFDDAFQAKSAQWILNNQKNATPSTPHEDTTSELAVENSGEANNESDLAPLVLDDFI
jgi:hypothetical protein